MCVCVCVCVRACMCVCMCVCVCQRDREREGGDAVFMKSIVFFSTVIYFSFSHRIGTFLLEISHANHIFSEVEYFHFLQNRLSLPLPMKHLPAQSQ